MSQWFKCDLQVATPGWNFKMPPGWSGNLNNEADRRDFADLYMARLKERGIQVVALADHHTGAWTEEMQLAGAKVGIVVFPGVEITTGTGSDGAHLLLIGNLDKTALDIDILLAKVCGFDDRYPRFNPSDQTPAPAPRTIHQILHELPPGWIAVAPHAFNDNGLASKKTVRGTGRWQALHDENLSAIDVGRYSADKSQLAWNQRFRNRELDDFPCLDRLAFISTSDAYSLDSLGSRFTWIRMAEPSLEGLRQAFLDYDSRIICDWDDRLKKYPERDPNLVTHPWLEFVSLGGRLGNSTQGLSLEFSPGLNVVIGGRGSGKSTVVSGIRRLYGETASLPDKVKTDLEEFYRRVFADAELEAVHRLPVSGERQTARWTQEGGGITSRDSGDTPTRFPVRVFSQKELYERVAPEVEDPYASSRHLLALIDEGLDASGDGRQADFSTELTKAENDCQNLVSRQLQVEAELQQQPELQARSEELGRQVAHLDNPATVQRRQANEAVLREHEFVEAAAADLERSIEQLLQTVERDLWIDEDGISNPHHQDVIAIRRDLREELASALTRARGKAAQTKAARREGAWADTVQAARTDDAAYQAELREIGVNPEQYLSLREEHVTLSRRLQQLATLAASVPDLQLRVRESWNALDLVYTRRSQRRLHFVDRIRANSHTLQFHLRPKTDWYGWEQTVRQLLNLRSDGYIEDARMLARWLWQGPSDALQERLDLWRRALMSNSYTAVARRIQEDTGERPRTAWWNKWSGMDRALRIRVATTMADDVVTMRFLKHDGDPHQDDDWQDVAHGSPGQRSAAMLSFVLHHGGEPLVLDQPEDDLDTSLISELIVTQLRESRWKRQLIVITHNPNIPVLGNADRIIVLENIEGAIRVKSTGRPHIGPIDVPEVRVDVQNVMEGGVNAFVRRGKQYSNELSMYQQAAVRLRLGPSTVQALE
ncbi:TrlF family AAA-like ATPase [Nonomuraea sp. NPDC050536]|uniref:TrlF family AAA-like ATPase n=1 Tax=Nonomuraea sp. NPDC050536 TaxID=3364366 RepID=UPI0037C7006C